MRIPSSPAPPSSSAHSDQSVAATTPSDTSVSIVDAPCRAARNAAAWNGHAAHVTTGSESAATTHCQPVNCSAGTIDSATTGTVSTAATRRRCASTTPRSVGAAPSSGAAVARSGPAARSGPMAGPGSVAGSAEVRGPASGSSGRTAASAVATAVVSP